MTAERGSAFLLKIGSGGATPTYATVAGLALAEFKRLPSVGDHFALGGYKFEIMDMDGRKIDKLLVATAD